MANPAPTHRSATSSVRSSARTENLEAYRDRTDTIGCAMTMPRTAPLPQRTRLSASSVRRSALRLAPSALRTANSGSRFTLRASTRFATFEHAITKTSADAANSTRSTVRARTVIWSRRRTASMRKSDFAE